MYNFHTILVPSSKSSSEVHHFIIFADETEVSAVLLPGSRSNCKRLLANSRTRYGARTEAPARRQNPPAETVPKPQTGLYAGNPNIVFVG